MSLASQGLLFLFFNTGVLSLQEYFKLRPKNGYCLCFEIEADEGTDRPPGLTEYSFPEATALALRSPFRSLCERNSSLETFRSPICPL